MIAVVGARIEEDERDADGGGEIAQERLGVRVALLVDEEEGRMVFNDAAGCRA